MASPSKEENILKLILENSPLKEWRFDEIVKLAKVTKMVANKWLKKYVSEKLLCYVKEKGKFPYYVVGSNNPIYYSIKRIYLLDKLHSVGLISKLLSINEAKTIIIFGSVVKGDWYKDSDIDIFVFGNISNFNQKIESALAQELARRKTVMMAPPTLKKIDNTSLTSPSPPSQQAVPFTASLQSKLLLPPPPPSSASAASFSSSLRLQAMTLKSSGDKTATPPLPEIASPAKPKYWVIARSPCQSPVCQRVAPVLSRRLIEVC